MTITTLKRIGALALVAAFALGACSGGGSSPSAGSDDGAAVSEAPADLAGTVTIDGSSTVYPITQAVAEEFQAQYSGVQVPVAFSGTGGGFQKFCRAEIDISDASRPISDEEKALCQEAGIEYQELKVAIDGIAVMTQK